MVKITKELLIKEYIENEKSMKEIAKEYKIAVGTVFNYIKKYNITSRKTMSEKTKDKIRQKSIGRTSPMKGRRMSYESRKKMSDSKKGKYRIKTEYGGHKKKRKDGYIYVYLPTHPNSTADGYIMEHILVLENSIGRYLKEDEVVHHINKIRNDNRIENLKLMTFKEHSCYHMKERWEEKKKNG